MAGGGTPQFTTLPPEILQNIASQVRKRRDLVSLSLTSKAVSTLFRQCLWRSLTVEISEDTLGRFPRFPSFTATGRPLDHTRELHFSSEFVRQTKNRCPHFHGLGRNVHRCACRAEDDTLSGQDVAGGDGDDVARENNNSHETDRSRFKCFENLATGAASVLSQLPKNTLCSFSWDIGTCLPGRIFGHGGILALEQSEIESLSITTDCACDEAEYQAGLYELKSLKQLRWRAPNHKAVRDLSAMIHANADSLRHLEVDLVNLNNMNHHLRRTPFEAGPDGLEHSHLFWMEFLRNISGPAYPALQTLCLTEVGLRKGSAGAFDFGILRTLKLRDCERWEGFLRDAVRLHVPIGLKTFEIQARFNRINYDPQSWAPANAAHRFWGSGLLHWDADEVVSYFLGAFDGLEKLYVNLEGPMLSEKLFLGVSAHRATPKSFVHDLRMIGRLFDPDHWPMHGMRCAIAESADNFQFGLEAIGLSFDPAQLIQLLRGASRSTSLRLIHLRRAASADNLRPLPLFERTTRATQRENIRLQPDLRKLVAWAFGKKGIPSLKVIACGDYAYGGQPPGDDRYAPTDVIICRPRAGSKEGFRIFAKHNDKVEDEREKIIDEYRDLLEACPKQPLLHWHID